MPASSITTALAAGLLLILASGCGGGSPDNAADEDGPAEGAGLSTEASGATVPQLVAPGVVSTDTADELQPAVSADGRTLYFTRRVGDGPFTLHRAERGADGEWGQPEPLAISGTYGDQEPSLSRDGRRLYFTSDRPLSAGGERNRGRQPWVAEWNGRDWSDPRPLDLALTLDPPTDADVSRFWGQPRGPTEGPDGQLYFWAERPDTRGHSDLYRVARADDGTFGEPQNLGAPLNSPRYETGLAFSPDGAWMIFGRDEEEGGYGLGDLYVSRRDGAGWSQPRNLGPVVNSAGFDASPVVTADGARVLFSSNRARDGAEGGGHDIYVVPVDLILR